MPTIAIIVGAVVLGVLICLFVPPVRAFFGAGYRRIARPLLEPWRSIADAHFQFMAWVAAILVLGLAAGWLPLLLLAFRAQTHPGVLKAAFESQLHGGALASFAVAILAEGLVGLNLMERVGVNKPAAGIRGLVATFPILLILLIAGIMGAESTSATLLISPGIHMALGVISLLLAAYLYCFRLPGWEQRVRTAGEEKEKQDAEVSALAQTHLRHLYEFPRGCVFRKPPPAVIWTRFAFSVSGNVVPKESAVFS